MVGFGIVTLRLADMGLFVFMMREPKGLVEEGVEEMGCGGGCQCC